MHVICHVYGAGRCQREEAPGKAGKEYGTQSLISGRGGDQQYLDVNEWQVAGVKHAIEEADRGELIPHDQVRAKWVNSWSGNNELPLPRKR